MESDSGSFIVSRSPAPDLYLRGDALVRRQDVDLDPRDGRADRAH